MRDSRRRGHGGTGQTPGGAPDGSGADFTDWNNPEDEDWEDTPPGYYDDAEDDSYLPGPDDPDYDLSEAAGYAGWEAPHRRSLLPRWLVVVASLLLILALLTPLLIRIS